MDNQLTLKKNNYSGKLIIFEGTDGAGKTTMINMTMDYLVKKYGEENVSLQKQPTDLSRKTRLFQKMMYCGDHDEIDYRAVQLLTLSDRVQHNHEVIEPRLKQGKIVVCDRYIYTSVANMLARGYRNEGWFFEASKDIIKPDLAFLAYVPPDLAIQRIQSRPEECNRHLNKELLIGVASEFIKMRELADFKVLETDKTAEIAFIRVKNNLEKLLEVKK